MSVYDEILSSSSIVNVLEYYGLKVNKNKCTCPFHNDSHPSMMVNINKGIAKCFACGSGGNAISFIQKYESEINHNSITTVEAMQKAIDIQHLNIVIPQNSNIPLTEEQKKKQVLSNILKDAITICENNINTKNVDSERTLEYLKSRNLSTQIINNFHIGFNPSYNNITNELLSKYNMKDLIKVGIAKESKNEYIDIFSQRIMIPIFDEYGNPVGFGARVLDSNSKPKYINTMATTLFNKSEILFNYHKAKSFARDYEMIVVEGYMDVISSNAIGFPNTVGIMGTALTKEQIELGWEMFVNNFLGFIDWNNNENIVIDGVRHIEFFNTLMEQIKPCKVVLVWVEIDENTMSIRMKKRNESGNFLGHMAEGNLEQIRQRADIVIVNGKEQESDSTRQLLYELYRCIYSHII